MDSTLLSIILQDLKYYNRAKRDHMLKYEVAKNDKSDFDITIAKELIFLYRERIHALVKVYLEYRKRR